ncbi:MAG TPA: FAD-dependent oxidoreductase [Longimicrobiales bacterium]
MADGVVSRIEADVAVVGAGPAGIAAAVRAAESGLRVVVVDEGFRPGGQIWRHRTPDALPPVARRWLGRLERSGARVLCQATVVDAAPEGRLTVEQPGAPMIVEAGKLVLATGARERYLPFPGWTLPNTVGVGGAQALLKAGASFAGKRVVVAGSGPLLLAVAAGLAEAGARVAVVAEQAPAAAVLPFLVGLWRWPGKLLQAAGYRAALGGARYAWGTWVVRASGDDVVREVTLTDGRRTWTEPCDLLCVGYGLVPNTELARLLGCAVEGGRVVVDRRQETTVRGVYCAGEPTGIGGAEVALLEGEIAGYAVAGREGEVTSRATALARARRFARRLEAAFALREELRRLPDDETIVCRCEDVCYGRLRQERSARSAKLFTRAGMGPCQGRICGPALEFMLGWPMQTVRAPVAPATVATLSDIEAPQGAA